MNEELAAAKKKAETTYNAAADAYDAEPLEFWRRTGQQTVQRLALREGDRVLDVCCGSGASAIPAAKAVGSNGEVIAVDLAEALLQLGRIKAKEAGLDRLTFERGDMTALAFPDAHFDAVICVFGIFFVPDMEAQLATLWRLVKPGGKLAITTWGPGIFAPAYGFWLDAVKRVRPDLHTAFNPWDRITTPEAVRKLFADAEVQPVDVVAENSHQSLRGANDFWVIAMGSGLRWTIDQLGQEAACDVRQEVLAKIADAGTDRIATNVIYAMANRPATAC